MRQLMTGLTFALLYVAYYLRERDNRPPESGDRVGYSTPRKVARVPSFESKRGRSLADRASASGAGREQVPEPTHSRHLSLAAGVPQVPGMGCTTREMGYEVGA